MERHHPEKQRSQDLEKRSDETVGRWVERLLVVTTGGESSTEDEDRYGIDLWVPVQGFGDQVPVDLTLETAPDVIEKKRHNALETGFVVFEATPAEITTRDLKLAAQGGINFQEKVLDALDAAITDWAKRLKAGGRSFTTRRELADRIAADEAYRKQQEQRRPKNSQRPSKGAKKRYKREKRARHAKRAS